MLEYNQHTKEFLSNDIVGNVKCEEDSNKHEVGPVSRSRKRERLQSDNVVEYLGIEKSHGGLMNIALLVIGPEIMT